MSPVHRPPRAFRSARGGFTLLELLVAIAILIAVAAILIPSMGAILSLQQHSAARDLALTYERLHDEAVLRNVTFRIAYHLDENYYDVEVGDPNTLIFDDPKEREAAEKALKDNLKKFQSSDQAQKVDDQKHFETIDTFHRKKIQLPADAVFGGVYTPEYSDMVRPTGETDQDKMAVVYSYLFANGFAEPTVVQIADANHPDDGYTIVVEPLTGQVQLLGKLVDQHDVFRDVPAQGPSLP